ALGAAANTPGGAPPRRGLCSGLFSRRSPALFRTARRRDQRVLVPCGARAIRTRCLYRHVAGRQVRREQLRRDHDVGCRRAFAGSEGSPGGGLESPPVGRLAGTDYRGCRQPLCPPRRSELASSRAALASVLLFPRHDERHGRGGGATVPGVCLDRRCLRSARLAIPAGTAGDQPARSGRHHGNDLDEVSTIARGTFVNLSARLAAIALGVSITVLTARMGTTVQGQFALLT